MELEESSPSRYTLQVTAGPAYDPATHSIVPVNAEKSIAIETEHAIVNLCVRIQNYTGLPAQSPRSSEYFSHPSRLNDQYSIATSIVPKQNIPGQDIVFGNDFDRPIRDRLPPGTNYAIRLVKWMIDPGLEVDAYADKPYMYGPALSSWNYFRICGRNGHEKSSLRVNDEVIEEGAEGSGEAVRVDSSIPYDPDLRRKFFLDEQNRSEFEFEKGRIYKADFGNSYIGFNDFTLRLPGFTVQVTDHVDEKNHVLRYVLKNKRTGDVYFVVLFTLLLDLEKNDEEEEEEEEDQDNNNSELD